MVKELRLKTDAGMMDCKNALVECDGNMDEAVKYLREKGIAKAAKKADREAKEGVVATVVEGKDRPWRDYQSGRRVFAACGGAAIYRRKLFDEIGCMDEHHFAYLEDIDLGYRARLSGYVNLYIPEAVVYHAGSGASGSRYNEFKVSLTSRNSVYLVYKNMPAFQILLNLPLLLVGFAVKGLFFARKGLGRTYLKGLGRGIAICLLGTGRERRVRFSGDRLYNCFLIQLELWRNIWYRFADR